MDIGLPPVSGFIYICTATATETETETETETKMSIIGTCTCTLFYLYVCELLCGFVSLCGVVWCKGCQKAEG